MARHVHEYKNRLRKRFSRIEGHVRAVNKMIQEDKDCEDILIQVSAVIAALKSCSIIVLQEHMVNCMVQNGDIEGEEITRFSQVLKNVIKRM